MSALEVAGTGVDPADYDKIMLAYPKPVAAKTT